jgi:hypothetical protein
VTPFVLRPALIYWLLLMMRLPIAVAAAVLLVACSKNPSENKTKVGTKASSAESKQGKSESEAAGDDTIAIGDKPLANGKKSLEELGQAIVDALAAKNGRSLLGLAIAEVEYKTRLLGVQVTTSTAAGAGPEGAWQAHNSNSLLGMKTALEEHGGKPYTFVALESTKQEQRLGLVVHQAPVLRVEDEQGQPLELSIPASLVEHEKSGTFAVLSY